MGRLSLAADSADLDVGLVAHRQVRGGHHRPADAERETAVASRHDIRGEVRSGERSSSALLLETAQGRNVLGRDVDDRETSALRRIPVADGSGKSDEIHAVSQPRTSARVNPNRQSLPVRFRGLRCLTSHHVVRIDRVFAHLLAS